MSRWLLGSIGVVASVLGLVVLQPDLAALDRRVTAIEERLAARPIGTVEAERLRMEGAGDSVSEPFPLEPGTVLLTAHMSGEGHNAVEILPAPGATLTGSDLLVNETGPYEGTLTIQPPESGDYVLAVTSDRGSDWSVVIEQ